MGGPECCKRCPRRISPAGRGAGQDATGRCGWPRTFRRRGSRSRRRQPRRRIPGPMTDLEGWQKPMWGAVSGPERLEERQRWLGALNGRAQAVIADAADMSLSACVSPDMRAVKSKVRGKPKRGWLPLSRRRIASKLWLPDGRAESQKYGYPQGGSRDADEC